MYGFIVGYVQLSIDVTASRLYTLGVSEGLTRDLTFREATGTLHSFWSLILA